MRRNILKLAVIATAVVMASCGSNNVEEMKLIPVRNGKEYQYVNRKGEIVINAQFNEAGVFRNGLALVQTTGDNPVWGYIGTDGKYAINAQYLAATSFCEDLAWVVEKDKAPAAIDKKGEVKFTLQQAETVRSFSESLAAFSIMNSEGQISWGFVDKKGEVKINPQFDGVSNFSEGLCAFRNKEYKWGFIDKEGKMVINPQFDEVDNFVNGHAVVLLGEKYGVIDKKGKYTINPQFSEMTSDGDWFQIVQGEKTGWCDSKGAIVINPQFESAFLFGGNDLVAVKSGKDFGYVDKKGKFVINPQFEFALPFNGSLAIVENADRIGFIDKKGQYVVNPQFDGLSYDVFLYLGNGGSEYNSVNTDYFNVDAVVSIINVESPEGFTEQSTFNDIKTKYALSESDFNKGKTEHRVISSKKISKNTTLDFYVYGKAFNSRQVKQGSGWFSYYSTTYAFAENNIPTGYSYKVTNADKMESIRKAIHTKLTTTGYTQEEEDIYTGKGKEISIYQGSSSITVNITYLRKEKETADDDL